MCENHLMFYIIRLDIGKSKIIVDAYDYLDKDKVIVINKGGEQRQYKKEKLDQITDHQVKIYNHFNIYTLDKNKIETYKKMLSDYYVKKWTQEISIKNREILELEDYIQKVTIFPKTETVRDSLSVSYQGIDCKIITNLTTHQLRIIEDALSDMFTNLEYVNVDSFGFLHVSFRQHMEFSDKDLDFIANVIITALQN